MPSLKESLRLNKIRNMLNKNLILKQRRESSQNYNADTSGDASRNFRITTGTKSPKSRMIMSNLRNRNHSTIDADNQPSRHRGYNSALRNRNGSTIDEDIKNRCNTMLDRFIKNNQNVKQEEPAQNQQILLDKDIEKLYPISSLVKVLSGMMSDKTSNYNPDSRNEDMNGSRYKFRTKKNSTVMKANVNPNDKSDTS